MSQAGVSSRLGAGYCLCPSKNRSFTKILVGLLFPRPMRSHGIAMKSRVPFRVNSRVGYDLCSFVIMPSWVRIKSSLER